MSTNSIHLALVQAYRDGGFLPDAQTAFENAPFTPTNGTPWAQLSLIPNQPAVASLGDGGSDEHTGVFQIALYYPAGSGTATAYAKADTIAAHFQAGKSFTHGGIEVRIRSCGRAQGRNDGAWFRVPVSIVWYTHTFRQP